MTMRVYNIDMLSKLQSFTSKYHDNIKYHFDCANYNLDNFLEFLSKRFTKGSFHIFIIKNYDIKPCCSQLADWEMTLDIEFYFYNEMEETNKDELIEIICDTIKEYNKAKFSFLTDTSKSDCFTLEGVIFFLNLDVSNNGLEMIYNLTIKTYI